MKKITGFIEKREILPVGMVQFGEGNFLRAFVDYMLDKANEVGLSKYGAAIVKPIRAGSLDALRSQEYAYTVLLRGSLGGTAYEERRIVTCVQNAVGAYEDYEEFMALARLDSLRYIVSNTTEAGITFDGADRFEQEPPDSFPAKLTKFLYERYTRFGGSPESALIMLPCELIDDNGAKLKECVLKYAELWGLGEGFRRWLEADNIFANTLVDRIVTGFPKADAERLWEEMGYKDELLDCAEPFLLWAIEGDGETLGELPFGLALDGVHMRVIITPDLSVYRERKVRILNGAHSAIALAGIQMGLDTVLECVEDGLIGEYLSRTLDSEIIPTLSLPPEELASFKEQVTERFSNPYIRHELVSIALNSVSKWRARLMPPALSYMQRFGSVPQCIAFSLAAMITYYQNHETHEPGALDSLLGGLADYPGFLEAAYMHKADICTHGVRGAMERLIWKN